MVRADREFWDVWHTGETVRRSTFVPSKEMVQRLETKRDADRSRERCRYQQW